MFKREEKRTKKGKIKKGRPFSFPRCYVVLKDDEKWKKREDIDDLDLSKKRKRTIDLEDDASSEDGKRSPTPNSVSYSKPKRPDGTKKDKEKKKRKRDDEIKNAMKVIVNARRETNEVRKIARNQDAAAKERRLTAEERRMAAEERRVALEERKMAMEERAKLLEWEKHLFFLDTSLFNDAQKEYVNLVREEVLIQKRVMIDSMGGGGLGAMGGGGLGGMGGGGGMSARAFGGMGSMGGFGAILGGMGFMGGFGAIMETMRGIDGFVAPPDGLDGMGGMGGMSFASFIGGMGAPPDVGVPPSYEDDVQDLGNTFRASRDDDSSAQKRAGETRNFFSFKGLETRNWNPDENRIWLGQRAICSTKTSLAILGHSWLRIVRQNCHRQVMFFNPSKRSDVFQKKKCRPVT